MNVSAFFKRLFFLCFFLLAFTLPLQAQNTSGVSSDGKDFYIGLMFPSYNKVASPQVEAFWGAFALISSYSDNTVRISYFDPKTGVELPAQSYKIPARTGIQIQLDSAHMRPNDHGDTAEYRSCHITSDQPINIQFFSTGACSGGSYLALSTPSLGKKYVIASYADNPGHLGLIGGYLGPTSLETSHGCFEIVAPFDNTNVLITPNTTTMGGYVGYSNGLGHTFPIEQPYNIRLHRGECYLVKSAGVDEDADISGSIVTSDKPIAVLSGHENAALGGTDNRSFEGRDYMVEQMIPVDDWDTAGYVSIPLKDSQPQDLNQPGIGENYRIYSYDTAAFQTLLFDGCVIDSIDLPTKRLKQPLSERSGVVCPVDCQTRNGKKFGVMMYDNRNFGSSGPYPAPSMMTIIPISRWQTSFMWYVPTNRFEVLQYYYINIICQKGDLDTGIKGSFNGGMLRPIKQLLSADASYKSIPNHPELMGQRFRLSPGSYFAIGSHPFMIYYYGFRGFDPDYDLGDYDGDDFFFSYANPAGASLSSDDPGKFKVTVDSQCGKWNICVHDQRKSDRGIRSVTLLNDPMGVQFSPGKQSVNCHLDPSFDPGNFGEVELPGTDSVVCFTVLATKPVNAVYAAILVTDNAGNKQVIEAQINFPQLSLSPQGSPINFGFHGKGSDTCIDVVIKNIEVVSYPPRRITSASITGSQLFSITSVQPPFPLQLKPNDSVILRICFTGKDTSIVIDSLRLGIDCFTQGIPLVGQGIAPIVLVSDIDFGNVDSGMTVCMNDTIRNIGIAPLILGKNFLLHDTKHFSVTYNGKFPLTIAPGTFEVVSVCYSPNTLTSDSTSVDWITNENDHAEKDFSFLKGKGIVPRVLWNVNSFTYYSDTVNSLKARFWLHNFGTYNAEVPLVEIRGLDSAQFTIIADQFGYIPLSNFQLHPGDSIWVDIRFMPQLSGLPPARYADRHAVVTASAIGEKTQVLNLTATFAKSSVQSSPHAESFAIRPNPAFGGSVILTFNSSAKIIDVSIFDVLGREIYKRNINNEISIEIPIRNLQNGIYYARVNIGGKLVTQKFEVMR